MPSVSVIVPVHDAEATLGAQLEALAAQDFDGEWELVVADNGSTDGTVALVRKWTDRLPALRVVDARGRRGVSHARNVGAAAACGELLAICDADDVVTPGWLSALVAASADGDVLAGAFDEESLNPPDVRAWRRPRPTDEPAGSSWFRPYAVGANCAVWARVLDDIGGWDEAYVDGGNDVELSWRAQQHGYRPGRPHPVAGACCPARRPGGRQRPGPVPLPLTGGRSRRQTPVTTRAVARRPGSLVTSMALGNCSLTSLAWVTTRIWRKRLRRRSRARSMRSRRSSSSGPNTSSSTSRPTAPPDWKRTCSEMATRSARLAKSISDPENRSMP
ncbi:MAG: glycosyltransferase [Acidimicrobiia bacterium]|nr:glycosyltransferase [Acidimicrobiia bacterium]